MKNDPQSSADRAPVNHGLFMRVLRRGGTLTATALVSVALLSACGSSSTTTPSSTTSSVGTGKKLNMARVIASIEESIFTQRHLHSTVTCPTSVEQKAGVDFTCYAIGTIGKKPYRTPFDVTQVNNSGYVTYHS